MEMGMRYQKRVKICKGVNVNISKSGFGISAGIPGARISVGPNGVRKTVGIPGTGISHTETSKKGYITSNSYTSKKPVSMGRIILTLIILAIAIICFTAAFQIGK